MSANNKSGALTGDVGALIHGFVRGAPAPRAARGVRAEWCQRPENMRPGWARDFGTPDPRCPHPPPRPGRCAEAPWPILGFPILEVPEQLSVLGEGGTFGRGGMTKITAVSR